LKTSSETKQSVKPKQPSTQLLSFKLTSTLQGALSTELLSEVLTLEASQIVPIFDLPESVMGICNHRGDVLWLIDLAHLLGLEPLFSQNTGTVYSVMVLSFQHLILGVVVAKVGHLISCNPAVIQPLAANEPFKLGEVLQGLYQDPQGNTFRVVNGQEIFNIFKRG
jgi:positive phototaxis protein PixI